MAPGSRIQDLAPRLYNRISTRARNSRTVHDALTSGAWARDLGPSIDHASLEQFMSLWPLVTATQLHEQGSDVVTWAWSKEGQFSASSVYQAKFWGLQVSPTATLTWESKSPLRCRVFSWLAAKDRCWTSDRLA